MQPMAVASEGESLAGMREPAGMRERPARWDRETPAALWAAFDGPMPLQPRQGGVPGGAGGGQARSAFFEKSGREMLGPIPSVDDPGCVKTHTEKRCRKNNSLAGRRTTPAQYDLTLTGCNYFKMFYACEARRSFHTA